MSTSRVVSLLSYPLILFIHIYRWTLSPLIANMGYECRFYPTCSQYAEDALRRFGAFRGSMAAIKRVLRCHPWHAGGYDPVE